jgi:peroxiredoxin Q/BCP
MEARIIARKCTQFNYITKFWLINAMLFSNILMTVNLCATSIVALIMIQITNKNNAVMIKKYYRPLFLALSFCLLINYFGFAQSKTLSKGDVAPLFTAQASMAGSEFGFSLKKALAKGPVVVYFYPSAYTGGCDAEAHEFAQQKDAFTAAGATIIGVSGDDIKRLNTFSADPDYCAGKFAVASDADGKIAETYGLLISQVKLGAKDIRGIEINHGFIPRTTYVIGKNGKVIAVFSSTTDHISATDHVAKSLAIVKGA